MVCYADTMDSTDAFDAPSPVQKEFSLVEYILDEAEERRRLNRECRSYREFKRRLKNLKHQREARRQSFDSSRDSTTNVSIVTNTSTSTAANDDDDTVATATTATHGDIEAARNVAATTTTTKSKSRPKSRSRSKSIPIPMPVPMQTTTNAIATTVNATSTLTSTSTTTNGLLKPLKIKTKRPHIEDSDTDDADYAPSVNYGKRRRVSMSSMPSVPSVPSNANTNNSNNSNNNNSSISIYNGVKSNAKSNAKSNTKSNGTNVNSVHPPPTTTLANPCKIQAPTKNLDKIREQRKHDRYRKRDRKRKAEPIVDFDGAVNKLIKSELNVDVEVMPPPSIKPRRKKAKATCKYCRKVISNRSNLLRHVRDVHKKDTSRYDSQCSSSAEDLIQSDNNNNFSSNLKRAMLHGKPKKPAAVENIVIECTPFDDGMMYKHFMADSDDLEDEGVVEKEPDYYNVKTPDLFHDEKMNIPKLTSAQIHGPRGNGVDNGIVYIKADSYAASINLFNCQGIKRKDKGTSVKNTASKDITSKDTTSKDIASKAVTNKSITNKDTIKDINKTNDASITKSTNVNNSVNSSSLNEEDESHQSMPEYSNPEYSQPEYSNHLNDNVNEDVHVNEDVNKSVNIGEECNDNGNEQSDVEQVDELDAINNVEGGVESNVEMESNAEMDSNVEIDSNVDEVEQENSQESLQEEVPQDESQTEANEDDQSQNEEHDTIDDDEQPEEQQECTEEQEHTEDQQECTEEQQEHSEAEPEEGSDSESESGSESGSGSSSSSGSDSESNSDAESNAESEDEDNASEQPAEAKVEVSGVDRVNDDVEECVVVESVQPEEVAIQEMAEIELPNLELEHELDDFPEPEGALSSDDLEPKRVDLQCEIDELMNDHVAFSKDSTIEAFNKIDELLSTIQPLPMSTMEPLADDDVNEDLNSLANTISNALIPNGCNVISNGMQPLVDSDCKNITGAGNGYNYIVHPHNTNNLISNPIISSVNNPSTIISSFGMKSSESVPINSAGDSINLYTLACVADNVQYNSNTNNNSSSSTSNINGASLPPCGTLRRAQDTATSVLIFDCKNVTFEPSNNTFYPTGPNLLTNTESELELEEESSVSGIADFSMYIRDMQNDDPLLSPMLSSNGSEKQLEQDLMVTTTTVDDLNGNCNLTDNSTGNNFDDAPMDIDGASVGTLQTTLETVETLQTEPLQTNTVEPLQTATVAKMDETETVGNDTVVNVGSDSIPANIPEPNHPNPLPESGVNVETNSGGNGTVSTNKTNDTNSTNTNNANSTNNTTNSNDIEGFTGTNTTNTNTNIDANSTTTNTNTNNHNNTNNTKPSSPIHRSVLNQFKKVIEHNSGWSNLDELLFMADYIEPTSKVYMMHNFKKLTTLQDSVSDIENLIRTEVKQSISKTTLDYLTAVVVHYIQTFAASMIMCNLRMGRKTVSSASYCNFAEYTRDLTMSTQEMLLLELSTSGVLLNLPTVESIILKGFMHALPHQHLDANSIEHETGILKMLYNIDLTDEFLQVVRSYAIKLIKSMGFMLKRENLTQIDLCRLSDTLKRHSNVFKLRSFLNFDMHPSL